MDEQNHGSPDDEAFVDKSQTYERHVVMPKSNRRVAVTLRPLDAGDRAEFNEVRLMMGEEGAIRAGTIQLLTIERALVSWGFEKPITTETVKALHPLVFDQIWAHVSFGKPTAAEEALLGEAGPTSPGPEGPEREGAATAPDGESS